MKINRKESFSYSDRTRNVLSTMRVFINVANERTYGDVKIENQQKKEIPTKTTYFRHRLKFIYEMLLRTFLLKLLSRFVTSVPISLVMNGDL